MTRRLWLATAALSLSVAAVPGTSQAAPHQQAPHPAAATPTSADPSLPRVGEEHLDGATVAYRTGTRTTQNTIQHPGATYIKVHFSSLNLAPGDYVTVADPSGREVYTYHGNPTRGRRWAGDSSYTRHGIPGFAAMSVQGDTAVVTLHTSTTRGNATTLTHRGYGVRIDRFWRGLNSAEKVSVNSVCGDDGRRDVVCYRDSHPTEYTRSQAVARAITNGMYACTAWRVGNTNRMLTNNHCIGDAQDAAATELHFGYECATCGGNDPGTMVKISAAQFLKTSPRNGGLDYTLISVDNFETIRQFGTLYLDPRDPVQDERIYIAGHGSAAPKQLSLYEDTPGGATCKVDEPEFLDVHLGYNCDTTGGSSGSPVLAAANHKVIGLHHSSGCPTNPNSGTRISLVYNEIRDLIDNTDPNGRDFTVTLSPGNGAVDPGGTVSASVVTATTAGEPQPVTLSASGLPNGATASFNPTTVTSGGTSTMTITTTAATPPGTYPVTVTATGTSATHTATYQLTINEQTVACPGYENTRTGTLTSGSSAYQPDGRYYYTPAHGTHQACLTGPAGADFDLYLQKWTGYGWATVARSTTPAADEQLTYTGTSGYYRYRIHAYTGTGDYTLGYNTP